MTGSATKQSNLSPSQKSGLLRFAHNDASISPRRAGLHELIKHRIHQRLERSVDDVGRDTDRGPALPSLILALDQHARHRFRSAIEDTNAIVDQLQPLDVA